MIDFAPFQKLQERYVVSSMIPLKITAELDSPVVAYNPIHFDGLLAKAVVLSALQGEILPTSSDVYNIPLPLACLWRDPQSNLPLWASTDFVPDDPVPDTVYWHKRAAPVALMARNRNGSFPTIRTTQGQYKEYRVPMPTLQTSNLVATCIGSFDIISELLPLIGSGIGKKRSIGFGLVSSWKIGPIDSFSLLSDQSIPLRHIPFAALLDTGATWEHSGWTPPYWHPHCQTMCLATDVPVDELTRRELEKLTGN